MKVEIDDEMVDTGSLLGTGVVYLFGTQARAELSVFDKSVLRIAANLGINTEDEGAVIHCCDLINLLIRLGETEEQAEEAAIQMTADGPVPVVDFLNTLGKLLRCNSATFLAKLRSLGGECANLAPEEEGRVRDFQTSVDANTNGRDECSDEEDENDEEDESDEFECKVLEKTNSSILLREGEVDGDRLLLRGLKSCTVYVLDFSSQVVLSSCRGTTILLGPVRGEVLVKRCKNCTIAVACSQLCVRDSVDCEFRLHLGMFGIIERSSRLVFAPWNGRYPGVDEHLEVAGIHTCKYQHGTTSSRGAWSHL